MSGGNDLGLNDGKIPCEQRIMSVRPQMLVQLWTLQGYTEVLQKRFNELTDPELYSDFDVYLEKMYHASQNLFVLLDTLTLESE